MRRMAIQYSLIHATVWSSISDLMAGIPLGSIRCIERTLAYLVKITERRNRKHPDPFV
jgi:hypothetical protein